MASDDVTVFVKASPDGHHRGACPECQSVCMWLQLKQIVHTETYIDMNDKPEWFIDIVPNGSVPSVNFHGKVIEDSDAILDYLEKHTPPEPNLSSSPVAMDTCSTLLKEFRAYFLNEEQNKESKRKVSLDSVMVELHDYLDATQHNFLSGDSPTRADCVLIPRLFHVMTVLENYKKYSLPPDAPLAVEYMGRAFALREFKDTACSKDVVLQTWAQYKRETLL